MCRGLVFSSRDSGKATCFFKLSSQGKPSLCNMLPLLYKSQGKMQPGEAAALGQSVLTRALSSRGIHRPSPGVAVPSCGCTLGGVLLDERDSDLEKLQSCAHHSLRGRQMFQMDAHCPCT